MFFKKVSFLFEDIFGAFISNHILSCRPQTVHSNAF